MQGVTDFFLSLRLPFFFAPHAIFSLTPIVTTLLHLEVEKILGFIDQ